jgi:peptidoglycan/LPS O-acetylase OafA/YrhL
MQGHSLKSTYYPSLDGLRGVAALMVVYGHAGYAGWVPLLVGCATIGVILFFFLSGFLMGHHYMPPATTAILDKRTLNFWAAFLFRRFTRVYPPYFFAPILGYLLLMPALPPDFDERIAFADLSIIDELLKIATFKGTLGIYWTIKVELFFYLLYPLIITLYLHFRNRGWTLFLLFITLAFFNHFPHGLGGLSWRVPLPGMWTGYMSIFVAGIFTATTARKTLGLLDGRSLPWNALALLSSLSFVLLVALFSQSDPTQQFIWKFEWLFAALFFLMFISLVHSNGAISRLLSSKACVWIGSASYSLYLIHVIAFHIVIDRLAPRYIGAMIAGLVLLVLTSIYYKLFERPFVQLSKRISVKGKL